MPEEGECTLHNKCCSLKLDVLLAELLPFCPSITAMWRGVFPKNVKITKNELLSRFYMKADTEFHSWALIMCHFTGERISISTIPCLSFLLISLVRNSDDNRRISLVYTHSCKGKLESAILLLHVYVLRRRFRCFVMLTSSITILQNRAEIMKS